MTIDDSRLRDIRGAAIPAPPPPSWGYGRPSADYERHRRWLERARLQGRELPPLKPVPAHAAPGRAP